MQKTAVWNIQTHCVSEKSSESIFQNLKISRYKKRELDSEVKHHSCLIKTCTYVKIKIEDTLEPDKLISCKSAINSFYEWFECFLGKSW